MVYALLDTDTTTNTQEFGDEGNFVGWLHFNTKLACTLLFSSPSNTYIAHSTDPFSRLDMTRSRSSIAHLGDEQ
jgi:hypothetical protein